MIMRYLLAVVVSFVVFLSVPAAAQEATIHHGFLFFAGEKYTMDEETFGIYDDGHEFEELIKDNPEALSAFGTYRGLHITANVAWGLSFAAIVFGGAAYIPGVDKKLGDTAGIIGFATGGGLLLLGTVFEFIAWGQISSAAEIYNRDLIDEGPALKIDPVPTPTLAVGPDGGHLALTWRF